MLTATCHGGSSYEGHLWLLPFAASVKYMLPYYILLLWEEWQKEGKSRSTHLIPQTASHGSKTRTQSSMRPISVKTQRVSDVTAEAAAGAGEGWRGQPQ